MTPQDIKEFETGRHCFGEILTVNGTEYEDLDKQGVLSFINTCLTTDINSEHLTREVFKMCLDYLQHNCVDSHSSKCDQCGDWNE